MKTSRKIAVLALVSILMAGTFAFTTLTGGKVILIVSLEVKNYTEWKKGFDAGEAIREDAGIKVLSVCRSAENENQVVVIEEAENAKKAQEFLALLKSKQKAGDMSKLEIKMYDKQE